MKRALFSLALVCACSSAETTTGTGGIADTDGGADTGAGGSVATGGTAGTGGAANTGGTTSTGGTANTGGVPPTGGSPNVGGTEAGTGGAKEAGPPPVLGDQVDVLFVIDNSSSMADKQAVLAGVVPDLVSRLVDPVCVDSVTGKETGSAPCATGSRRQLRPIASVHVGIISTSIGGHGTTVCPVIDSSRPDAHNDDAAHLITRGAPLGTADTRFLDYAAGQTAPHDVTTVENAFGNMVLGVGQHGCGYEAQLEAPYRFLVDPEPPLTVTVGTDPGSGALVILTTGPDPVILDQRASFLRPNSIVLVVLVSDEDDCSLRDEGQSFLAIRPATGTGSTRHTSLEHGTTVCQTNPNDPCCFNCGVAAPAGCPPVATDPACQAGYILATDDPDNLRCWDQKRRYGIDFLYPVTRYIDGFSAPTVKIRSGQVVANPLFVSRPQGSLFFAAIVGVPWQDVARDPVDLTKGLKSSEELVTGGWSTILGDPAASPPVPPGDPLMIASVLPRAAMATNSPLGAAALPKPPTAPVGANPVNGHEWDTSQASPPGSDLQYACVFDLLAPRDCADPANTKDCDCVNGSTSTVVGQMNPLCQGTSGYTTTQVRAKAYPGLRELAVVKGLGPQGIVGSICPANLTDSSKADWGYRPVIAAILERIGRYAAP
jgi:hypothetical protein